MSFSHMNVSFLLYSIYFIYNVFTAPQQPEINDQFESTTTQPEATTLVAPNVTEPTSINEIVVPFNVTESRRAVLTPIPQEVTFTKKLCNLISLPFVKLIAQPKVNSVLRNIGTCIVNGAMEIVTYYFPAPLIPLIATAAGMVIPFEPVVMLREKMPVTSYRRAFRTALNSFLSTFDRYRLDDEEDDPYMTRRFNRRVMNYNSEEKKEKKD